jgi:hypothetical protein
MRRRSVLISALASAGASTFAVGRTSVVGQEATLDAMASHPIVGAWLVLKPSPVPVIFVADGTITDDQVGVRITAGALLLADATPAAGTPTS